MNGGGGMRDPRIILGFTMVGGLIVLALAIAIGHVHADASYGLTEIIECLKIFAAGFVFWAFTQGADRDKKPPSAPTV